MFKILKNETDPDLHTTEIQIKIPGFQNFGLQLEKLEDIAAGFDSDSGKGLESSEDVDAELEELKRIEEAALEKLRKRVAEAPDGPQKEELKKSLRETEAMISEANTLSETDGEDIEIIEDEIDPETLSVFLPEGTKWDEEMKKRVAEFLDSWPALRSDIQSAVFKHYREQYPAALKFYKGADRIDEFLPKPTKPEIVSDLFRIETVYLLPKNVIGLTGTCIWDDEHGIGIKIKGNKVTEAGEADIVY